MEIERIEDWTGQDVVDGEGEKIGRLEDVFFADDSREAVLGAVKTGLLGRSLTLVPLGGATVTRDHIRVVHSKQQVKDAPKAQDPLDEVRGGEAKRIGGYYGVELGAGSYEGAKARAAREAEAHAARERAEELDRVAEAKAAEAETGEAEARQSRRRAETATEERERALREAERARREASDASHPPPKS